MEDHQSSSDSLVEEREELMIPPSGGKPLTRNAHFLKPIFTENHLHLPSPNDFILSTKTTFEKLQKYKLVSYKRYPSEKWKLWVQKMKPKYQDIWKNAGIYEAILASTYTIPKDKKLIFGLAERWCPHTNTFIFPWGEVTITLEDVLYLGCYSVLGDSFLSPLDDEYIYILNCLRKHHKKARLGTSERVTVSMWMEYFMCSDNHLEHEAFLVLWLSSFVLVSTTGYIAVQNFQVAIHLSRGNRIALAPVVLASIYRSMSLLHNSIVEFIKLESKGRSSFVTCHDDLVQMWTWERFPELRPVANVIERGEPRAARWNRVTELKVKDVRAALDSSRLSFLWRPYAIYSSSSFLGKLYTDNEQWVAVESDAMESFARCLRVSELSGSGYTEQYLPHRVALQFGLDQDLPSHVNRSNESPETAWSTYNRPIRGLKLYVPPRLFESDFSSRYVAWWRGLVPVNEEMMTNNLQIEERLPLFFCKHKRDAKSSAIPGCLSGGDKYRPKDDDENDGLTIAQLMSQSRNCTTEPLELGVWSVCSSDKCKKSKCFYERQTEHQENVGVSKAYCYPEVNIVNSEDNATSQVPQKELQTLDTCGCPSACVIERTQDNVDEDSLTIAQLLSRSKKRKSFEKAMDADDEPILNTCSEGLLAIFHEAPTELNYTNEPVDMSVHGMSFSDKGKKSKSSTDRQAEPENNAVLSKKSKCSNELVKLSVQSMSSSEKFKKSNFFTEKQTEPLKDTIASNANIEPATDEVVRKANRPEDNIVNIEEDNIVNSNDTTSELQHMGIMARILRLEMIIGMIKAIKYAS